MKVEAVIFDIGNVLIEWNPERFYDRAIGAERRRDFFAALDLHAMNDDVDRGAHFRDTVTAFAAANPDWHPEIMMWHDSWREMATPAIDHSVRLLRALRRQGVPVFALQFRDPDIRDRAARVSVPRGIRPPVYLGPHGCHQTRSEDLRDGRG